MLCQGLVTRRNVFRAAQTLDAQGPGVYRQGWRGVLLNAQLPEDWQGADVRFLGAGARFLRRA